jgi:hypothetical protein
MHRPVALPGPAEWHLKQVESRDFGVLEDVSSLTMPKLRAA